MVHSSIASRYNPVQLKGLSDLLEISPLHVSILVIRHCDKHSSRPTKLKEPLDCRVGKNPVILEEIVRSSDNDHVKVVLSDPEKRLPNSTLEIECNSAFLPGWFRSIPNE